MFCFVLFCSFFSTAREPTHVPVLFVSLFVFVFVSLLFHCYRIFIILFPILIRGFSVLVVHSLLILQSLLFFQYWLSFNRNIPCFLSWLGRYCFISYNSIRYAMCISGLVGLGVWWTMTVRFLFVCFCLSFFYSLLTRIRIKYREIKLQKKKTNKQTNKHKNKTKQNKNNKNKQNKPS